MNVHEIIDKFIESINSPEINFQRIEKNKWVDDFETKLSKRFPVSFYSLISRYSFNAFDYNGLSFFANLETESNLSLEVFKDRYISEITLQNGFIQFASPDDGSYDPICFNTNISKNNREFPIVRIDHESILCRNKIRIIETLYDSFLKFAMEKVKNG